MIIILIFTILTN